MMHCVGGKKYSALRGNRTPGGSKKHYNTVATTQVTTTPLMRIFRMRLTSISQLPKDLVNALGKCGIRTDTDLLFSRSPLEVFHSLPNGIISLSDFLECFNVVTEVVSAPGMRAIDTFTQDAWVKTGVPIFDELVGESSRHEVIEISGARGSGKSASIFFPFPMVIVIHFGLVSSLECCLTLPRRTSRCIGYLV
jgi:hypothetical protein